MTHNGKHTQCNGEHAPKGWFQMRETIFVTSTQNVLNFNVLKVYERFCDKLVPGCVAREK